MGELSDEVKKQLDKYASVIQRYIDTEMISYTQLCKKRPKKMLMEAEKLECEKQELQKELGIGWRWSCGLYELDLVGANHNPGSSYCDEGYWFILPLKSDNEQFLEYLRQILPNYFQRKEFQVRSTMVPAECSVYCGY